ncbi:hypothetical protein [Pleomorphomonas koreensis]|uniref:mannitol dehydrogenase family protein n=1 Tax=Pleomorphomonas koreensis TaxID=257440 RepID=UPI000409F052|nr:hypothetical protein [Pleomorphomonas koreensis]
MKAVHFGAGALGRGLVVPRLVDSGWTVTLVDASEPLVDGLRQTGRYALSVLDGAHVEQRDIEVAAVLALGREGSAVAAAIAGADLVTTSVRRENLPGVLKVIASTWQRLGRPDTVTVLGCENVEHVDRLIRAGLLAAGLDAAVLPRIPATLVDRICAALPLPSLEIRTEPYAELAVERLGDGVTLPGPSVEADIDAAFDRKRYLVNSVADGSSFLGLRRGHAWLAEAAADAAIAELMRPFIEALLDHLEFVHGFSRETLDAYLAVSQRRLANPAIPRRLDTVARDILRKLGPTERFMAPLIELAGRGRSIDAAARTVALIAEAGLTAERPAIGQSKIHNMIMGLTTREPAVDAAYSAVAAALPD